MLERIKKKQFDGFRDFVENMEVTASIQRPAILMNGILEDPRFMRWVTKNLRTFKNFMELPADEIEAVIKTNDSVLGVLAKAVEIKGPEDLQELSKAFPRFFGKLKEEIEFRGTGITASERESAQFFLLKTVRRLQRQEAIQGFRWELPPPDVFQERPPVKDGVMQIFFEDGTLAAEGEVLKGKRIGVWRHYYDDGRLLAEGTYVEGLKHGKWLFHYGQGSPRAEGKFISDVRQGLWREWDRNGVEREIEWVDGKRRA